MKMRYGSNRRGWRHRAMGDMLIESPAGRIPLRSVAEVIETDGPNQILRENGRRRLVVISCIDNLLKGAAGQAVQNMNLMYGWAEDEGLQ